jgi:hypothetical protein
VTTVISPAGSRLLGRLTPVATLPARTTEAMFDLMTAHFDDVDRITFEKDLGAKNSVILLEDEDGLLRGFSTLLVYRTRACGRAVTVVYSGDTIVERAWWGSPALPRTWIDAVRRLTPISGSEELYWLLLTSGYRTYRFLPVFFQMFYPRYDESTPIAQQSLLDAIAFERFGSRYHPEAGVVRFERPYVLAPDLLDVPSGRAADAHINFFLSRNPGYRDGDELVCLTRIDERNLTPAGRRMARQAFPR